MAKEVVTDSNDVKTELEQSGNPTTITNILSQSLKSGDAHLLETALGITDAAIIEASLQRLPAAQVPTLLNELTQRISYKPNRMQHLLPWIRGCISVHASSLMGNPNALKVIEPLETLIERRLSTHDQLLQLAGRLDLLMMQVVRRTDQGEAVRMASLIHKPLAVYQEDDDSEGEIPEQNDQTDSELSNDENDVDSEHEMSLDEDDNVGESD